MIALVSCLKTMGLASSEASLLQSHHTQRGHILGNSGPSPPVPKRHWGSGSSWVIGRFMKPDCAKGPLSALPLPPRNQCLQTTVSTPDYQIYPFSLGSKILCQKFSRAPYISEGTPLGPRYHHQSSGKTQSAPVDLAMIPLEGKWEIKQR